MYNRFKHYVEHHPNHVLTAAFFLGFVVPGLEAVPDIVVPGLLALVIFFSCVKITMDEIRRIPFKQSFIFYVARFVLFPLLLAFIFERIAPGYRDAVVMMAIVPAGSSSAAWNAIMGGNVALAMGVLVLSSLLAPFVIPGAYALIGVSGVELDLPGMFLTLSWMIFLPVALYFLVFRHVRPVQGWMRHHGSCLSILMTSGVCMLVVGKQRDFFFDDMTFFWWALLISCAGTFVFYAMGWLFGRGRDRRIKMTYAICSGFANYALGISLGLLYFPEKVSLLLVIAQIPLVLGIIFFRRFLQAHDRKMSFKT